MGFPTLEAFLRYWEEDHESFDARDLLAMLWTWQNADLSDTALSRIQARTIIMPCDTDMYFTQTEAALETAHIPHAELRLITSPYGHCAGAPNRYPTETALIEAAMHELLVQPTF
jgi:homoserine O-acetyltransferase